jgi:hypothetical protein
MLYVITGLVLYYISVRITWAIVPKSRQGSMLWYVLGGVLWGFAWPIMLALNIIGFVLLMLAGGFLREGRKPKRLV